MEFNIWWIKSYVTAGMEENSCNASTWEANARAGVLCQYLLQCPICIGNLYDMMEAQVWRVHSILT